MDWQLDKLGWRFVRYADDFVIVCQTPAKAEEALAEVRQILHGLGLTLSVEKTKITTYRKGYSFLGFWLSSRSRRMRPKSLLKFKDKIRELTCRKHNFEAKVIVKLNQVIRGTAQYFATPFFTARETFHKLNSWIRMRMRAMKYKRKSTAIAITGREWAHHSLTLWINPRALHGPELRAEPHSSPTMWKATRDGGMAGWVPPVGLFTCFLR